MSARAVQVAPALKSQSFIFKLEHSTIFQLVLFIFQ